MKEPVFTLILILSVAFAFAQNVPKNPKVEKCYMKCITPEVWKNEQISIEIAPAYKKIIIHPSIYKTVSEKVILKEAEKRIILIPAIWENKEISYTAKEAANEIQVVEAVFKSDSLRYKTQSIISKLGMSTKLDDCNLNDPNGCKYWYYDQKPSNWITLPITALEKEAFKVSKKVRGLHKTYIKKVMVKPPATKEIEIPAVYGYIKKKVLVKKSWQEEISIAAKYKTITKKILVDKGGRISWQEVDCN